MKGNLCHEVAFLLEKSVDPLGGGPDHETAPIWILFFLSVHGNLSSIRFVMLCACNVCLKVNLVKDNKYI